VQNSRNERGEGRWLVLPLATLAMFMDGFDALIITVAAPDIVSALGMPLSLFGAVLGCGQIGVAVGALVFGALGDRYPLRLVTLLAFALFTLATLATPMANDATSLITIRFLAGLGIGGLKPLLTRLVREFTVRLSGVSAVSVMFLGYGTGGVAVSLLSARFLSLYGWQAFFLLAGVLSLVVLAVLAAGLPRAPKLRRSSAADDHVPDLQADITITPITHELPARSVRFARLFAPDLRFASIALMLAFGMNSATQTYFSYWIPTLVRASGGTSADAGVILAVYLVGGIVGGLLFIRSIELLRPRISVVGYGSIAAFVTLQLLSLVPYTSSGALALFGVAGAALLGSNYVILGLPARFFPTSILSSGSGLCTFAASVGAVIGPWLGGYMIDFNLSRSMLMLVGTAPLAIVGASIFFLNRHGLRSAPEG
jgi:AAHS family 4-hydroxybenzoate transporter-like MFS transporter